MSDHLRMGHDPYTVMMGNRKYQNHSNILVKTVVEQCHECVANRVTKHHGKTHDVHRYTEIPGGELSADLFGPFFNGSWGLVLRDKVTGFCVVDKVDAKHEATRKLKTAVEKIVKLIMRKRQVLSGTMGEWITQVVHKIRVDNEFSRVDSLNNFAYHNLVNIQSTAPGGSEQN